MGCGLEFKTVMENIYRERKIERDKERDKKGVT